MLNPSGNGASWTSADYFTSFDADGYSFGTTNSLNRADNAQVAWGWRAGGAPGGGALSLVNGVGAGTIADTGNATNIVQSVSQTSGFSITHLSGHNSGITFPHNLGGTPAFVVGKSSNAAMSWAVWHKDLTGTNSLRFDTTAAQVDSTNGYSTPPN